MNKETIESNKVIAEFMGYKLISNTIGNCYSKETGWDILMIDDGNGNTDFPYNSSWNWLMPIVEKIEDFYVIKNKEVEFQVVSYEDEVKVIAKHLDKEWEVIVEVSANGDGKKLNIYKAIVIFINWYNKNK